MSCVSQRPQRQELLTSSLVSFLTNSALVNAPSVTLIHHNSHKTKQISGNKARGGGRRNQEELFDK